MRRKKNPITNFFSNIFNVLYVTFTGFFEIVTSLFKKSKKNRKEEKEVREFFKAIIVAVVLAVLFRSFLYEPFNIPSGSMIPTLYIGDHLFVSKFDYGYSRYSLPYNVPLIKGRIFSDIPKRGDIVVFKNPKNDDDYIKRMIGLPGDKIQMIGGELYINEEKVKREFISKYLFLNVPRNFGEIKDLEIETDEGKKKISITDGKVYIDGNFSDIEYTMFYGAENECGNKCNMLVNLYKETLPNGVSFNILEISDHEYWDNTFSYVVPENHYFVMGDNRDNSSDSRVIGYIPHENLIGSAKFLFHSHDGSARFWEFWNWSSAIRWDRYFKALK